MKLTITDKVFVPVSVKDELPECDSQHNLTFLSKTVAILTDEGLNATEYYHKIDSSHKLVDKGWNHQGDFNEITHWLKEETNKYVLSQEELKDLLSKVFRAGNRRGYSTPKPLLLRPREINNFIYKIKMSFSGENSPMKTVNGGG